MERICAVAFCVSLKSKSLATALWRGRSQSPPLSSPPSLTPVVGLISRLISGRSAVPLETGNESGKETKASVGTATSKSAPSKSMSAASEEGKEKGSCMICETAGKQKLLAVDKDDGLVNTTSASFHIKPQQNMVHKS
ncbi:hypothetical protein BDK51DRAFT_27834 [Blyttiomyces helicus]|uniref:Uncharacterized protein n=1 Tax=Blyttiomyces helicus TaxID=388810 RepID=A0A4P9WL59_9FUNG|nr:hypothetical protein BDK51DRAFT_27834 [Blyttiomyces helicus]|eukprot:RKO93761.1 hypothetical protein BDK51DRAFT_27834 [Blyttiomyces helicus]